MREAGLPKQIPDCKEVTSKRWARGKYGKANRKMFSSLCKRVESRYAFLALGSCIRTGRCVHVYCPYVMRQAWFAFPMGDFTLRIDKKRGSEWQPGTVTRMV